MTLEKDIPQFLPMMGRKVQVYYRGITKIINCYQPGHIKKTCKKSVGWIDYVQKFKEEHDFSDEMFGNWIKILDLNKVRKEKEMQRKQHLENIKKQRDKTTTDNEEEPGGKNAVEEDNLPEKSKQGKQLKELEEEKQLTRVEKPK